METKDIKLETLAIWLSNCPGSSCGASYEAGQFSARICYAGREFHGQGETLEQAFYWALDAWNHGGRTAVFSSPIGAVQ